MGCSSESVAYLCIVRVAYRSPAHGPVAARDGAPPHPPVAYVGLTLQQLDDIMQGERRDRLEAAAQRAADLSVEIRRSRTSCRPLERGAQRARACEGAVAGRAYWQWWFLGACELLRVLCPPVSPVLSTREI